MIKDDDEFMEGEAAIVNRLFLGAVDFNDYN